MKKGGGPAEDAPADVAGLARAGQGAPARRQAGPICSCGRRICRAGVRSRPRARRRRAPRARRCRQSGRPAGRPAWPAAPWRPEHSCWRASASRGRWWPFLGLRGGAAPFLEGEVLLDASGRGPGGASAARRWCQGAAQQVRAWASGAAGRSNAPARWRLSSCIFPGRRLTVAARASKTPEVCATLGAPSGQSFCRKPAGYV